MKPRPYQVEVLVWTLLDFQTSRDSLVYLPTGSGKTLVGALVTSAMASSNPKKRVAFVVDKVPLLQQQADYLRRHTALRVGSISGDTSLHERRGLLSKPFDVLVITAKVFANMLARSELAPAQFSLVTFDEAHHCVHGHPFVEVMQRLRLCAPLCRPRVLGLTASPAGAATEQRTNKALAMLEEQLGASLRTPYVYRSALQDVMRPPEHKWLHVRMSPSMQQFEKAAAAVLNSLTRSAEQKLGVEALFQNADSRLAGWRSLHGYVHHGCPALLPCVQAALHVAEAAEISTRLGDEYGCEFLKGSRVLASLPELRSIPGVCEGLQQLLCWPRGGCAPHLQEVADVLRGEAQRRGRDFRAVVFVATRALARRLASILEDLLRPLGLNPQWLVGRAEGAEHEAEQRAILGRFRTGEVKLLAATSVAEEGLDVAECSVVVRLQGVRAFASHVQSRGRVRAERGVYAVVGTPEEHRAFAELQTAEEALQRVVEDRMSRLPSEQQQQVQQCTKQLLEGEHAHAMVTRPAVVDAGASDDVICVVVHGLPGGDSDDALRIFARFGVVVGCVCEGARLKLPDQLRPVGHSAVLQLQVESRLTAKARQVLLGGLATSLPAGMWIRDAKPVSERIGTFSISAKIEVGSFFSPGAFARQAVFYQSLLQPGRRQQFLHMSVVCSGSMEMGECVKTLEATIALMDLWGSVLVDLDAAGALTVYAPVTQPPSFSQRLECPNDGRRAKPERCCMPSSLFGSSFVYAFHFGSMDQARPLLSFLSQAGIHLCYAHIARVEHNLDVPELPPPDEWDELAWLGVLDGDWYDQPSHESLQNARLIELIRALNGPAVKQADHQAALSFSALYALLCALGEEPMLMCSVLSPALLSELWRLPAAVAEAAVAELPPRLGGRLFVDAGALLHEAVAAQQHKPQELGFRAAAPEHHVFVRSVTVTPTRLIYHSAEEMLSNRVLREFGEPGLRTADRFLRVQFRDEDGSELAGKALVPRMHLIFEHGIRILDRHFQYLHWSQSQMRSASLWLYASDGRHTCEDIRAWPFLHPETVPRTPSKYASRLALFLSSSLPTLRVSWSEVEEIKDVERNNHCFTDGAGRIREDVANEVARLLGCKVAPSAFQIRFGGAKGVVVMYPNVKRKLELRPSMVKFKSMHDSFEVVNWSRNNAATLNQQIILLLAARGVGQGIFLNLQEEALLEASKIVVDPRRAAQRLGHVYAGPSSVAQLDCAHVDFINEPFFSSLLRFLYRRDVQRLRQKTSIPVGEAALLLGVPDETETLNYGEVFIQVSEPDASGGVCRRIVKDCMVMVTKNPCLHPGDILGLRAVDCPGLRHIVDCVVFPVRGHRPHPDESSGSDLDGDLYFCTWCKDLVPAVPHEAMDFTSSAAPPPRNSAMTPKDMEDYFVTSTTATSLGVIANAHKVHADSLGAGSQECLRLAQLHSDAVDAPKTGQSVEVPRELVPKVYPAWMEKEDDAKDTSIQDTLLQRLHDQCPQVTAVADQEVLTDPRFILPGHERFLEDARRLHTEYCAQLLQLMRRFRVKWEAEIFTCTFERYIGSPKERRQLEGLVKESFRALADHYRGLFESQEGEDEMRGGITRETADWTQLKASAWYVAAYTAPDFRGKRLLSFAWLVADYLLTICPPEADGPQLPPAGHLFHSLAESISDVYSREVSKSADRVWRIADEVAQCLQGISAGPVVVQPAGLEGLGLLPQQSQPSTLELALSADGKVSPKEVVQALRRHFPRVESESSASTAVRIMSESHHPWILLNLDGCADVAMRRFLSGWLHRHPELAPVCFILARWSAAQSGDWPLDARNICLLFLRQQQRRLAEEGDPTPEDPFLWSTEWSPAALVKLLERRPWNMEEEVAVHPGEAIYSFLEWMLDETRRSPLVVPSLPQSSETTPRLQVPHGSVAMHGLRVALLRAYQQVCLDRHVVSLVRGAASPDLRSAIFSISGVRGDAPRLRVEEQLQALGRGEVVRVWLETSSAWPAIKVEVRGSRADLAAVSALISDLRRRLRDNARLRLLTSWQGQLVVDQGKQSVLDAIKDHRVVIVCASTGSGKSTGLPRMMLEDENVLGPKRIICTQPRRVGAMSLARRVAELCNTELGDEVGFRIGGAAEVNPGRTRLVYETTAIAMQQFLQGAQAVACTHLIVDEVHNRTVFDDVLLAVVKHHTLVHDKQLKVILMSAATNCLKLAEYFRDEQLGPARIVTIEGSLHHVDMHYLDEIDFFRRTRVLSQPDPKMIADFMWFLHTSKPRKSKFLVFLPGRGDIKRLSAELWDIQDDGGGHVLDIKALHAGVPIEKQQQMLLTSQGELRMVILATDIVESSVTIPDVDVVVDSCFHKRKHWNEEKREYELQEQPVSRDEALQRAGRTGRVGPGEVYRLITKRVFQEQLAEHTAAHMETASVSELLLVLAGSPVVKDPRSFLRTCVLSPPDMQRVEEAYTRLVEIGAVDNRFAPTLFGRLLQRLPLEPELGLLIWNGLKFGSLEDCEVLAGVVQRGSPFLQDASFPAYAVRQLISVRSACQPDSDLLAGLRAYEAWQKFLGKKPPPSAADEAAWCWDHYLSLTVLQEIEEMRLQIHSALADLGWAEKIPEAEQKKVGMRRAEHLRRQAKTTSTSQAAGTTDPVASLLSLMGRYSEDRRFKLARWCIALAFLPNTVEVTGVPDAKVHYKCKRGWASRLLGCLSSEFRLQLQGAPLPGRGGEVVVTFASPSEAQRAVQIGNVAAGRGYPYNKSPWLANHLSTKPFQCYRSAQMILGADSVCVPVADPPAALVGASVLLVQGRTGAHFMTSQLTAVPTTLLGPLLAMRASGRIMGDMSMATLRGKPEHRELSPHLIEPLVRLCKLTGSGGFARTESVEAIIQQSREAAEAVLGVMRLSEEAARADRGPPPVSKVLTQVPQTMHGKLIGKGGSSIKALKEAHPDVRIIVPKASEGGHVRIEGPSGMVRSAERAVLAHLGLAAGADILHRLFG